MVKTQSESARRVVACALESAGLASTWPNGVERTNTRPIHQESGVGHNHRQFSRKTKLVYEKQKQNDQTIPCAYAISTRGQIEEQTTNISRIISYHTHVNTTSTARRPTVDSDSSIT